MPTARPLEKANEALKAVNANHSTEYELIGCFSTGEWGAYRIVEPGGRPAVFKFFWNLQDTNIIDSDPDLARAITDHLRSLGYPTPEYLHTGRLNKDGLYWVMEELPGKPLWENPTVNQVEKLVSLLKLQRNQAVSREQDLSIFVKDVVFREKFGKSAKLKNYSDVTRELLDQVLKSVEGMEALPLTSEDIVHGDFSYHQAMVENGEIVGIIDWQEAGCGDWLIDLTRLIYSLHDRPKLAAPIVKEVKQQDPCKIKLYTAYTVLEMVSWPVYKHDREVSPKSISKAQSAINFVNHCVF
ncbi:MAG: aminoglycoside phosphotransferase family protein [Anaerolineae bacterium]|jgi:hypothetical protein